MTVKWQKADYISGPNLIIQDQKGKARKDTTAFASGFEVVEGHGQGPSSL